MTNQEDVTLGESDITENDRLWAAASWLPLTPLWPILPILALLIETTKDRPFIRRHAITSVVTGTALIPIGLFTFGFGLLLYLVFFYWAYQAFMGKEVTVPIASEWLRKEGWIS